MSKVESQKLRVAIVGASTLLGREIKSVLTERNFPIAKILLMDQDEDLGRLTEFDGEPVVSLAIEAESFSHVDVVFFAAGAKLAKSYASLAARNRFLLIDLTAAFAADGRVPLFFPAARPASMKSFPFEGLVSMPHPASFALARILNPIHSQRPYRQCVVNILEPASEHGSGGVEELERQALNIFSFQPLPQKVFQRQLAFNLLSRLGAESQDSLLTVEKMIFRQLKGLLSQGCPTPAITLIQAPIFHSYAFSIFLEMDNPMTAQELEGLLTSEQLELVPHSDEPPSPVQVTGNDRVLIGGIKQDFSNPKALWAWAVCDNLRLAALNAVVAGEQILLS
jgi:aspartate-semialdehyde dehydrogenase